MVTRESDTIDKSGEASFAVEQDSSGTGSGDRIAGHALLANLRHELRSLLNAIIGFSGILLEDMDEAGEAGPAAGLERVNQTGRQILAVISDVLDPTKIDPNAGKPDLQIVWGILHDSLRTQLSDLISQGEILLESARKAERQSLIDDLHIIYSSAKQLKAIVEQLAGPAGVAGMEPGNPDTKPDKADAVRRTEGVIRSLESLDSPLEAPRSFILVVDDDEANRGLLCSCLKREGHTVIAAGDGRKALDLLAVHDFDLVLLDVIMPQMDGYQVLKQIRSTQRLQNVPVIMISAFNEADSAVRCIEIGAEEYLTKPFDRSLLEARVRACLQKKMERDKAVRQLNAGLDRKASQLQEAAEELGASRRKIELLEKKTTRIQSAVRQEIEKIRRVSILDILVILVCGLILGLLFNAANPGGVKIIPQSWSEPPPAFSDLDSAKAKFDAKSVLFVDARPSEYFQRGHIPGAVSLPNNLFDFVYTMKLAGTDPEMEIIVYGRDISRLHDEETAFKLVARGHRNISIMEGNLVAWQARSYPVEK